ncbi:MAG: hypothetical protein WC043_05390 [Pseudobdellovibrionaceae bacterium]
MSLKATVAKAVIGGLIASSLTGCFEVQPDERTFSEGYRVGTVTKLSFRTTYDADRLAKTKSGEELACKNWEGELAMVNDKLKGSFSSTTVNGTGGGSGSVEGGNTFEFSLGKGADAEKVAAQLKDVQENGHRVKLTYNQIVQNDPCKSRTAYIITDVKDLGAPKDEPASETVVGSGNQILICRPAQANELK